MADEASGLAAAWAAASAAVGEELAAWRRAHPRATLAEIEAAVEAATGRLRRVAVEGLAREEAEAGARGRPACPRCGAPMERRGTKRRALLAARQGAPVRLERAYFVCPACHAGLSPPG